MAERDAFARHFRSARPRALAALTRYFRAVDIAEDAFQEACVRAVRAWPSKGVPGDPPAWLILVGRNAGVDALRRRERERSIAVEAPVPVAPPDVEAKYAEEIDTSDYRDDVLRLLFMCCHSELSVQDQLALALKVVAGFSVAEIARAFLVTPKAMEQRITRAKKKASAVATALETPSLRERTERLNAVLMMLYLMFNEGYSSGGAVHIRASLCDESIRLTRLLLTLFPGQPEVMGLLALSLLHTARTEARQDATGVLIPLERQDRRLWDPSRIAEGRVLVEKALRHGRPGVFQIQAAIAAVHCSAMVADDTDWAEIERLYEALETLQPSPVVALNRMVAVAKTKGPQVALEGLLKLGHELGGYLYFHSTAAALYAELGLLDEARAAFETALSLRPSDAEAAHIRSRLESLEK